MSRSGMEVEQRALFFIYFLIKVDVLIDTLHSTPLFSLAAACRKLFRNNSLQNSPSEIISHLDDPRCYTT